MGVPLGFVVGSTASGKSDLAVAAALVCAQKGRPVEIISADSVQIYRELVIGSARPSDQDLSSVRHHLIGHMSVADEYTAADFAREATAIIARSPETPFLVVGGSGFYIQALMRGLYPIEKANPVVRSELEGRAQAEGLEALYRELQSKDAATAAKIAPQDRYRIIRALEIQASLPIGRTLSQIRRAFDASSKDHLARLFPGRSVATFGLKIDRERLEGQARLRAESMVRNGLITETESLRAYWTRPVLQSVGYRETIEHLRGEIPFSELVPAIVGSTLRLAKKQRTWFGRDDATQWFDALTEREHAVQNLAAFAGMSET